MAHIKEATLHRLSLKLIKRKRSGFVTASTPQSHLIVMAAIKNCSCYMKAVFLSLFISMLAAMPSVAYSDAKYIETPYDEQNVVFDFYFDDPDKIGSALYWIRSLLNPLMNAPYNHAPEFLNIVVVIHGTEIVTVAKKNVKKYQHVVDRMLYYSDLGVKFKVCGLAAKDYQYSNKDFHDFIEVVPSAITELAHWQLKGYALITPRIMFKKYSIEEIR